MAGSIATAGPRVLRTDCLHRRSCRLARTDAITADDLTGAFAQIEKLITSQQEPDPESA